MFSASRTYQRVVSRVVPVLLVIALFGPAHGVTRQQTTPQIAAKYRGVSTAIQFDISPPLRDLALREPLDYTSDERARHNDLPSGHEGFPGPQRIDRVVQREVGTGTEI